MSRVVTAATWNLYHSTSARDLAPTFHRLREAGVTVLLLQEAGDNDRRATVPLLEIYGFQVHRRGQLAVAWTRAWTLAGRDAGRLSPTPFYRPGSDREAWSEYVSVVLCDRRGRTLEPLSYHTPSHVQVASPPARRLQVLRESMTGLEAAARASLCDAQLYGGDDNVDEGRQPARWSFMRRPATGLRLVQAPRATHAGGRRLDDFRTAGLRVGAGQAIGNASDHRIHLREFTFPR